MRVRSNGPRAWPQVRETRRRCPSGRPPGARRRRRGSAGADGQSRSVAAPDVRASVGQRAEPVRRSPRRTPRPTSASANAREPPVETEPDLRLRHVVLGDQRRNPEVQLDRAIIGHGLAARLPQRTGQQTLVKSGADQADVSGLIRAEQIAGAAQVEVAGADRQSRRRALPWPRACAAAARSPARARLPDRSAGRPRPDARRARRARAAGAAGPARSGRRATPAWCWRWGCRAPLR